VIARTHGIDLIPLAREKSEAHAKEVSGPFAFDVPNGNDSENAIVVTE
jgi:hypothetical protein